MPPHLQTLWPQTNKNRNNQPVWWQQQWLWQQVAWHFRKISPMTPCAVRDVNATTTQAFQMQEEDLPLTCNANDAAAHIFHMQGRVAPLRRTLHLLSHTTSTPPMQHHTHHPPNRMTSSLAAKRNVKVSIGTAQRLIVVYIFEGWCLMPQP